MTIQSMMLAKLGAGERFCNGGTRKEEMKSCNEVFTKVFLTDKTLKKAQSLKNVLLMNEPIANDLPDKANGCTSMRPRRQLARKHSSMHNLMSWKMPELRLKAMVSKKKKPIAIHDQKTPIGSTKKDGIRRSNSKPRREDIRQAGSHRKHSQVVSPESKNPQGETECKSKRRRSFGRRSKLSKLVLEACSQGKNQNKNVLSSSRHSLGSSRHSEKLKKRIRAKRLSSNSAPGDSVRPAIKTTRTDPLTGNDGKDIEQSPNEGIKTNCQRLSSSRSHNSSVQRASEERRRSSSKNRRKTSPGRSLNRLTKQSSKNRIKAGESDPPAKTHTIKKALMQKLRDEVTGSSHHKNDKEQMKSARRSSSQRRLCSPSQKRQSITPSTSQSRLWSLQPSLPSYLWGPPEVDAGPLDKRESDIEEIEASERGDSFTTVSSSDSATTVEVSNRSGRKVLDVNCTESRWDSCNYNTLSSSSTRPVRFSVGIPPTRAIRFPAGMPPLVPLGATDAVVDKRPSLPKRAKSGSCPCPRIRSITIDPEEDGHLLVVDADDTSVISELTMSTML